MNKLTVKGCTDKKKKKKKKKKQTRKDCGQSLRSQGSHEAHCDSMRWSKDAGLLQAVCADSDIKNCAKWSVEQCRLDHIQPVWGEELLNCNTGSISLSLPPNITGPYTSVTILRSVPPPPCSLSWSTSDCAGLKFINWKHQSAEHQGEYLSVGYIYAWAFPLIHLDYVLLVSSWWPDTVT